MREISFYVSLGTKTDAHIHVSKNVMKGKMAGNDRQMTQIKKLMLGGSWLTTSKSVKNSTKKQIFIFKTNEKFYNLMLTELSKRFYLKYVWLFKKEKYLHIIHQWIRCAAYQMTSCNLPCISFTEMCLNFKCK